MIGQLIAEADVAVGPMVQMKAVNPHVAVSHDAVEVYEDSPVSFRRRQSEMLAIPAYACRKKTARAARRVLFIKRAFNAPVVRHVQLSPRRNVETNLLRTLRIRFE